MPDSSSNDDPEAEMRLIGAAILRKDLPLAREVIDVGQTDDNTVEYILACAHTHGDLSEPDMEVGDLQSLVREMWGMLNVKQKTKLMQSHTVRNELLVWKPEID